MKTLKKDILTRAAMAKEASYAISPLSSKKKNACLSRLKRNLLAGTDKILKANRHDCRKAQGRVSAAFLDRLRLDVKRIRQMAGGIETVISLPDPIGEVVAGYRTNHPLTLCKVRVPLGVIGFIFESRPNVTVDATALCLKSGNALILKGGKEAIESNQALVSIIQQTLAEEGLPKMTVSLLPGGREGAKILMKLRNYVDLLIPRGGQKLIDTVVRKAQVPVIETGTGNCHVYVDQDADLRKAEAITINAKVSRPSVCNAAETLLVHKAIAPLFLPRAAQALEKHGVELRGCAQTRKILPHIKHATTKDYATEFLDLILAIRIVEDVEDAIAHIRTYHSRHTEAIVTENLTTAQTFAQAIDSACLMINCSTRFSDGFEFGLGAEVGISTQKLHARGPMGLTALTSTKTIVWGKGQIRR